MRKNKLAQAGSILFVLNMTASALNYLCQLLLARVLSVESFGTINTIFSFMLIVAVPGTTLTMIVARYYASVGEQICAGEKRLYLEKAVKGISMLTVVSLLLFMLFMIPLGKLMAIHDKVVLILAFVLAALGYFQPLYSGVLTGNRCFIWLGLYSLMIPFYKIVSAGVAYIVTDNDLYRLCIILAVMVLGTIVIAIIGHQLAASILGSFTSAQANTPGHILEKNDLYTLLLNVCLMIYMNIDLLSVRYLGTDKESGLYSSTLLFGRVLYYFSTTLGTLLLPAAADKDMDNTTKKKKLHNTLFILTLFSLLCVIPVNLGGTLFLRLLYGNIYAEAAIYIKYISLISISLSFCTVLTNYLAGIGKTRLAAIIILFADITILFYVIFVRNIIYVLAGIGAIGLTGAFLIYFFGIWRRDSKKSNNS